MSLDERIKAYGRQARTELINRYAKNKEKAKQGKAEWIGYSAEGNGLVKQDGKVKVVKVIGSISLPVGSSVLVDEKNTIEIRKAKPPKPKPKTTPALKRPGGYKSKSRPLIITDDDESTGFMKPIHYTFGPLSEWVEFFWEGEEYRFQLQPILSTAVGGQAMIGEYTVFSRRNDFELIENRVVPALPNQDDTQYWFFPNLLKEYRWDGMTIYTGPKIVAAVGPIIFLTVEYRCSHDGPMDLVVDSFGGGSQGSEYLFWHHEIQRSNYTRGYLTLAFNTESKQLSSTSSNYLKVIYSQMPIGAYMLNQEVQGRTVQIIRTQTQALYNCIPSNHPFYGLGETAVTTTRPQGFSSRHIPTTMVASGASGYYNELLRPLEYTGYPFPLFFSGEPNAFNSLSMSPDKRFSISSRFDAPLTQTSRSIDSYNAFSFLNQPTPLYLGIVRLVLQRFASIDYSPGDLYQEEINADSFDLEYMDPSEAAGIISTLNTLSYVRPSGMAVLDEALQQIGIEFVVQHNMFRPSLFATNYPILAAPLISYPNNSAGSGQFNYTVGYITDSPYWYAPWETGIVFLVPQDNYPTT